MVDINTVSIFTLGCRSNQYDSAAIEGLITGGGLTIVDYSGPEIADAYIINTCTVTSRTDSEARQVIRRIKRNNPKAFIIVTGCYAQVSPEELAKIEDVDVILGNPEKDDVLKYLKSESQGRVTDVGDYLKGAPLSLRAKGASGRTRANLKVQDGCDKRCTYCIIPMARGASKSLEPDQILSEMEGLIEDGFVEFVFTGIHLGAWGADLSPARSMTDLLREIEKRDYPIRIRLSSLDPDEVSDELIDIIASSSVICHHLHLPVQSGDDTILKSMGRPYTAATFVENVTKLHDRIPGISIGTDIISGFPGEGELESENTYAMIDDLPLSYLHVFPYSVRSGTPAASFAGQVEPKIIKSRAHRLRELDIIKRRVYYSAFMGKEERVLIESKRDRKSGLLKGRTRNYIPAYMDYAGDLEELYGMEQRVRLTSEFMDGLKAELFDI